MRFEWKDGANHSQIQSSLCWLAEFSSHSKTKKKPTNQSIVIITSSENSTYRDRGNVFRCAKDPAPRLAAVRLLLWDSSSMGAILGNYSNVGPKLLCFQNIAQQARLRPTWNCKHLIILLRSFCWDAVKAEQLIWFKESSRIVCRCIHGWGYTHVLLMNIANSPQERWSLATLLGK